MNFNIILIALLLTNSLNAQSNKITQLYPSEPVNYVTDNANIINDENSLNTKLKVLHDSFHVEMAVVTLPTIENYTPFEVALSIGRTWGVANKAEIGEDTRNVGLVLLIVPKTTAIRGQCFIATARGVEGFLTDNTVADICRSMISYFKLNNYDDGINFGINTITKRVRDNITPIHNSTPSNIPLIIIFLICIFVICIIVIYFVTKNDYYDLESYSASHLPENMFIGTSGISSRGLTTPPERSTLKSTSIVDDGLPPPTPIYKNDSDDNNRRSYESSQDSSFGGFSGNSDGYSGGGGGDSW